MQNLLHELATILEKEEKYISEGKLLKNVIIEDALKLESSLLKLLLKDKKIKKHFFQEIEGVFVFDKIKFQKFISNKQFLPDSYTNFKNKIGLTVDDEFITENKAVVLSWSYKDCVLEGGQDKEDTKRDEVFWNETLAPDEINRLLSPKVLMNWRKYDKDGEQKVLEITENDNFVIKGNNLLGLSTILKKFRGKVKLIYIDPPYNTGNDSFKYNDNFNHSTWLTFMKNRLLLAKELLSSDGSIFIQIDDFEASYMKVLLDMIFGRDNFRNQITWKRRGGSANPSNRLNNVTDYILWYTKSDVFQYEPVYSLDDENTQKYIKERFNNIDENGRKFMKSPIQSPNYRENLIYDYKGYKTPKKGYSISKSVMEQWDKEGKLCFPENKDQNINRKIYLDEYQGQPISSLWVDISVINPMSKERNEFESGQKPEALLKRIIEMITKENDIVLDFHLGSGTTAATCHKMHRRYIGIEQMNYIDSIVIDRLKNVISGESNGISPIVNWNGGGSFIYCELAKANQEFIERIQEAKDVKSLQQIWKTMREKSFISYNVDIKLINDNQTEFEKLTIEEQKRFLIEVLDKNMLYIPYSEIDDADYQITEEDKKLNHIFYGGKA